jgi:hypothetical protein
MRRPLSIVALSMLLLIGGCSGCENEVSQNSVSPSGRQQAVVFQRECGATVGSNVQVSILANGQPLPDAGGNTFIVEGSGPVRVEWSTDSMLLVSNRSIGRVFKSEAAVADVQVKYVP